MAIVLTHIPAGPLWMAAAAASAFMVFAAGRMIPVQAMLLGVPHPKNRGAFMSLYTTVQHVATGLAPIIAGALVHEAPDGHLEGFPAVGWVAAVTALISLVLAGLLKPARAEPVPMEAPKPPVSEAEVATDSSAETKVEAVEVTELVK
jgi:MFS family permease